MCPITITSVCGRASLKRPLAAFGNSDGDYEMLQLTTTGKRARLGVLVHHDDDDREYVCDRSSSIGKLDRGLSDAEANGYAPRYSWLSFVSNSPSGRAAIAATRQLIAELFSPKPRPVTVATTALTKFI
jgi:hypothetical protein